MAKYSWHLNKVNWQVFYWSESRQYPPNPTRAMENEKKCTLQVHDWFIHVCYILSDIHFLLPIGV